MDDVAIECVPEVFDIENTEAPVSLEQTCTREILLRPPDWRYQAACQYLTDVRRKMIPVMPNDVVVQYLIRGMRGMNLGTGPHGERNGTQRLAMQCWPDLSDVLYYGVYASNSAIANMMDTCLIKGWSSKEARMAGCPVSDAVYDLYSMIFFDLEGARTIHSWMQDFVFSPAMGSNKKLRARLMAFYGAGSEGVDAGMQGWLTSGESATIKKLMQNERQKQLFDYVVKQTRLPLDIYASVMEGALKSMSEHEFQEHMKDRDDAGSVSLEELADGIEEGVRAYSQHELEEVSQTGVDFTTQYTKVIIGNEDNAEKDLK